MQSGAGVRVRRILRFVVLLWVGLLGVFLDGCSGGGSTSSAPPAVQVVIAGSSQARLGTTIQLTATVSNVTNTAVTWQVNGVTGGAAETGTISTSGLYTPPPAIPASGSVAITALSQTTPVVTASQTEMIWNPVPTVTAATATSAGPTSSSFLLDVTGMGFVTGSSIQVGGSSVATTVVSPTELQAAYTATSGQIGKAVPVDVANPDPGAIASASMNVALAQQPPVAPAARFLDQTSFGPTFSSIQHVQSIGLGAALTEQFNQPATVLPALPATDPAQCFHSNQQCASSEWLQTILTGNDQLRQRVAFALTEIFVTSTDMVDARAETTYLNTLSADAFTNYRQIMEDVTLSTSMGLYLNMLNSAKPAAGQIANENYPRELMQLFTIGIDKLNADGSLQFDSNNQPIPNYTQAEVQAFAKAYTGWTFANSDGSMPTKYPNNASIGAYLYPMMAVEGEHDTNAKTILNGTVLPAGQTAEQDLKGALDDIFNDPSVGPFVGKQLIQHLVKGNPSLAYVARVSAAFNDDGSSGRVRGDMKAVLTAILMDPEARAADTDPTVDGGHLREPILYLTDVMRALGYSSTSTDPTNLYPYISLIGYPTTLSEQPLRPESVFNFFPPQYALPGTDITSPEFALENTASVVLRLTLGNQLSQGKLSGFSTNLGAASPLGMIAAHPGTGAADLVQTLNLLLMHGQMPAQMQTVITNAVSGISDNGQKVRVAVYLIITSSQYKVMN